MRTMNKLIMTVAGLLLIVAGGLKFYEMIDTCVPSWRDNPTGFWESYAFFLIQVPLEFALGVWMVCGLFRKAAWIAGTLAYFFFIFVTLGKWVTGAESCGCFGQIVVDPKLTLFVMDIPVFLLLAIFWPRDTKLLPPPWPNAAYLLAVFVPTIALMVAAPAAMVAFRPDCIKVEDKPDPSAALKLEIYQLKQDLKKHVQQIGLLQQQIDAQQQTIGEQKESIQTLQQQLQQQPSDGKISPAEPDTVDSPQENGAPAQTHEPNALAQQTPDENNTSDTSPATEQWDWLQYVVEDEVRQQLTQGLVVVMMHRYDCPTCEEMAPQYSAYYTDMTEQGIDAFKIAFLETPPYGDKDHVPDDTLCINGKLTDEKNWQLMSPVVVALLDGQLVKQWEQGTAPEPEKIIEEIFGQ